MVAVIDSSPAGAVYVPPCARSMQSGLAVGPSGVGFGVGSGSGACVAGGCGAGGSVAGGWVAGGREAGATGAKPVLTVAS